MDLNILDQINSIDNPLSEMERLLSRNLNPVTPRRRYIKSLKLRLYNSFPKINEPRTFQQALSTIASILGFIVLLIVSIRTLIIMISSWISSNHSRAKLEHPQLSNLDAA